jgi:hypothetical protein
MKVLNSVLILNEIERHISQIFIVNLHLIHYLTIELFFFLFRKEKQIHTFFSSPVIYNRVCQNFLSFQDLPPPGSYEVVKSYDKTQNKKIAGKPRSDDAARKQGAFLSSASRFAPPRDVKIEEADPSNPGKSSLQYNFPVFLSILYLHSYKSAFYSHSLLSSFTMTGSCS